MQQTISRWVTTMEKSTPLKPIGGQKSDITVNLNGHHTFSRMTFNSNRSWERNENVTLAQNHTARVETELKNINRSIIHLSPAQRSTIPEQPAVPRRFARLQIRLHGRLVKSDLGAPGSSETVYQPTSSTKKQLSTCIVDRLLKQILKTSSYRLSNI